MNSIITSQNNSALSNSLSGVAISQPTTQYTDTAALYEGSQSFQEKITPHQFSVNMEDLLNNLVSIIRKYCMLDIEQARAISLWIVSSYLINSFRIFPKLTLISPERRCGKTTALEVIDALCRDPMMISNTSAAVIYRCTEEHQPTLLIDEADTFIKNGTSDLIGIINSGHTKSGSNTLRCVGDDNKTKRFSTWMPMVLASIGSLKDTIMDRSLVINLRRKKANEPVDRLPSNLKETLKPYREQIARWCLDNQSQVHVSTIEPPSIGNDRAQDNWVPAFIVADLSGPNWEQYCNDSYRALTQPIEPEIPTLLLQDIRELFTRRSVDRIASRDLIEALILLEDAPWRSLPDGKKLSGAYIAKLLKPYGIHSEDIRFGDDVRKGYKLSKMEDAFARYLP